MRYIIKLIHSIIYKDTKVFLYTEIKEKITYDNKKMAYFEYNKDRSKKVLILSDETSKQIKIYTNRQFSGKNINFKVFFNDLILPIKEPIREIRFKKSINNIKNINLNRNNPFSKTPLIDNESDIIKKFNSAKTENEKNKILEEFLEINDARLSDLEKEFDSSNSSEISFNQIYFQNDYNSSTINNNTIISLITSNNNSKTPEIVFQNHSQNYNKNCTNWNNQALCNPNPSKEFSAFGLGLGIIIVAGITFFLYFLNKKLNQSKENKNTNIAYSKIERGLKGEGIEL